MNIYTELKKTSNFGNDENMLGTFCFHILGKFRVIPRWADGTSPRTLNFRCSTSK